jgi:ribosomal protein S18 acetylase RimI-like enzyme
MRPGMGAAESRKIRCETTRRPCQSCSIDPRAINDCPYSESGPFAGSKSLRDYNFREGDILNEVTIRPASPTDLVDLRQAVFELQEYERHLHPTRLSGEQIADAYLAWLKQQVQRDGAILVAEVGGTFTGFVAGWVVEDENIAETTDSNRTGYVSDVCVMPAYRGRRIAGELLSAIERRLAGAGITRVRIISLAANTSAQTAYLRVGYQPYEIVYEKHVRDGRTPSRESP